MMGEECKDKHKDKPIPFSIEDLKESDILRMLNASYIAKRFFGKSNSWFYQKLNNNITNGSKCEFTDTEIKTLRNALTTISIEVKEVADKLHQGL